MRKSKYIGGSKLVSFRLPIESLSSATIEIKAILRKYEKESTKTSQNSVKPTKKRSKTTLEDIKQIDPNNIIYKCGCTKSNGLFRRRKDCKELLSKH